VFPGQGALARRYGVSPSTISRFAQRLGIAATRHAHRERTRIPWGQIERLLVEGRLHQHQNGKLVLVFPELAELATEFDVSVPALARFVKQQRCLERRAALLTPASVTVE
jgi:AraC-like DNA-binding protein